MKRYLQSVMVVAIVLVLSACGGGPKADVSIYTMTQQILPVDQLSAMESGLQTKIGETPKIQITTSPLYSVPKLILEVAAGGHSLLILNQEEINSLLTDKRSVHTLEGTFDPADYPKGIFELQVKDPQGHVTGTEQGFFAVPIEETAWFKSGGYNGPPAFAIIPANAENPDAAKEVLKAIVEY